MKQESAVVYYKTGNTFLKKGNLLKAISSYKAAIRLDPLYAKAHSNLGVALKNAGLFKEAITYFERALVLKPNQAVVYNNLGNVYTKMNRHEDAIRLYRRAIVLKPDYKEAYHNLGSVLYFTGKTGEALDMLVKYEDIRKNKWKTNK